MVKILSRIKNIKIIKYIRHNPLLWLPISGALISFFLSLLIFIFSDISFSKPDYIGFKNFILFYEIPLKFFLVTITIWGIIVAYRTYTQTKEMFVVLNIPYVNVTKISPDNKITDKLRLFICFSNSGNTPAYNFSSDIKIISPINKTVLNKTEYPLDIPPQAYTQSYFDLEITILNKISNNIPIRFSIAYFYYDHDNTKFDIKGIYEYYPINGETANLGKKIITTKKS